MQHCNIDFKFCKICKGHIKEKERKKKRNVIYWRKTMFIGDLEANLFFPFGDNAIKS